MGLHLKTRSRGEATRRAPHPTSRGRKPPRHQASRVSRSPKETKLDAAATTNVNNGRTHLSNLPPRSNVPHTHIRDLRQHPIRSANRIDRNLILNRINHTCSQAQFTNKAQQTPHRMPLTISHLKVLRPYEKTAGAEALAVRSNNHERFSKIILGDARD